MIDNPWAVRPRETTPPPPPKKKSRWGERASWKAADGVCYPPSTEEIEELSLELLLKDRFQIWDHIWGQIFTKVSKSIGEVLADDVIEDAVRDAIKVRTSSFFFYRFELCSSI